MRLIIFAIWMVVAGGIGWHYIVAKKADPENEDTKGKSNITNYNAPVYNAPVIYGTANLVLPSTPVPVAVVMKDFNEWVDPFSGEICQIIPTHWMPLPAPPGLKQSNSAEITLFKKPNDPNERVNKPNYNPPSFEDFDK